jgi:hypothetical protein
LNQLKSLRHVFVVVFLFVSIPGSPEEGDEHDHEQGKHSVGVQPDPLTEHSSH